MANAEVQLSIPVFFADQEHDFFADHEHEGRGRADRLVLIDNGDFVSVLARRPDGSMSWVTVEVPKADAKAFCDALLYAASGPAGGVVA